ncbi:sulfoxide reductase heme-binding subunit YedZ [Advenella sp. S44]|uniref:sulfite oxidase heme-binding subunit YedZ n=1 Tax=Advenella sp. S44 TaxID=1982755 RepID=UPI000C2A9146|nr:protein-methionine-sulfoxide reductase heme-binding subunit MsrQ [Advenella sp. S44]PJX26239.1 sulfoxide reductase heme-binding subunit YedZ [Advenella sp. S44]
MTEPTGTASPAAGARVAPVARRRWTAKQVGRGKPLVFLLCLIPFLRWFYLGYNDGLSANPVEFITRSSGFWTLFMLLLTLAVTPLRQMLDQPALVRLRRMLGLFAFFYVTLHLLTWIVLDRNMDLSSMITDVLDRTFIFVGMAAFLLMLPLALTSTQGWMRRLGMSWTRLHRSIYAIGVLGIVHYWLMRAGKNDFADPILYGTLLALLLLWRVARAWRNRRRLAET